MVKKNYQTTQIIKLTLQCLKPSSLNWHFAGKMEMLDYELHREVCNQSWQDFSIKHNQVWVNTFHELVLQKEDFNNMVVPENIPHAQTRGINLLLQRISAMQGIHQLPFAVEK